MTEYESAPIISPYRGRVPQRWGQDLIALVPRVEGEYCLDFGCGSGAARQLIEEFGHRWIGIDVAGNGVSACCDGHNLPFKDQVFATIVSIAVFEHLHDPFAAARELYRVLKPGGILLGTVAFLEPFHENSYFHMTHLGVSKVLQQAGLEVLRLWPTWHLLESQVELWLPFRVPLLTSIASSGARLLSGGTMSLRSLGLRLYLRTRGRSRDEIDRRLQYDRLTWTGSVGFLARKQGQTAWRARLVSHQSSEACPSATGQR